MKLFISRYIAVLLPVLLFISPAFGQAAPGTDIFLTDLVSSGNSITLGAPENITDRDGYDNQPSFTFDGKTILYTSIREDNQADIYKYDIASKSGNIVYFTSPEAEYSATMLPRGRFYSCIRVEKDGTQRLWKFPLGDGPVSVILTDVKPVGYHAWADADRVAMFILGDRAAGTQATLQIADVRTGEVDTYAENVGRSLHKVPGKHSVSFVHKISTADWKIKAINIDTKRISEIVSTIPSEEDYCWTPDGMILTGSGSKLFGFKPGSSSGWVEIADLSKHGIKNITRLAVSPDGAKIAIVSNR